MKTVSTAEELAAALRGGKIAGGYIARCPAHDDRTPSLSIRDGDVAILLKCHAGCERDAIFAALRRLDIRLESSRGNSNGYQPRRPRPPHSALPQDTWGPSPTPIRHVAPRDPHLRRDGRHKIFGAATRHWIYRSLAGPLGAAFRFDFPNGFKHGNIELEPGDKQVIPKVWFPQEKRFIWGGFNAPRPLYNLDKLEANPDAAVIMNEGEKAADACAKLFPDFIPSTTQGGIEAAIYADLNPLRNRRVIIIGDYDAPGNKYICALAAMLYATGARRVQHMAWPIWHTVENGQIVRRKVAIQRHYDLDDARQDGFTAAHVAAMGDRKILQITDIAVL